MFGYKHKVRVRADILRAVAMKNNKPGQVEMYVAPFSSRPVLRIKDMVGSRPPYALTFADAITSYGSSLVDDDLAEAYRRAGTQYDRQMRQTFVALEEDSNVRKNLSQTCQKGGYAQRNQPGLQGRGSGRGGTPRGRTRGQAR